MLNNIKEIKDFEAFFNANYVAVSRYSATIVKDIAEAEDIVQQVFAALWQKRETLGHQTSRKSYLYKAVYNASLDFLKHQKVKRKHESQSEARITEPSESRDIVIRKETERRILDALEALPEQCGRIFRMSRFDNLKYREIAAGLNISEKTVEKQMGKALKYLRRSLKEYLDAI